MTLHELHGENGDIVADVEDAELTPIPQQQQQKHRTADGREFLELPITVGLQIQDSARWNAVGASVVRSFEQKPAADTSGGAKLDHKVPRADILFALAEVARQVTERSTFTAADREYALGLFAAALAPLGGNAEVEELDIEKLLAGVDARVRQEWPGARSVPADGFIRTFPEIREGGATDTLVRFVLEATREELLK